MPTRLSRQNLLHKIACRAVDALIAGPIWKIRAIKKPIEPAFADPLGRGSCFIVAMRLNLTLRKSPVFRSPAEVFLNKLGKSLTIRFNSRVAFRC